MRSRITLPRIWIALGAFVAGALLPSQGLFAQATILINNLDDPGEGFNDLTVAPDVGGNTGTLGEQRLNVFNEAAAIWGAALDSSVTIVVEARFDPQFCAPTSAILGTAGPNTYHRDFVNAGEAGTWYPAALANKQSGADLNGATDEIGATFNSDIDDDPNCFGGKGWYYGFDHNEGTSVDLLAVVLHELGHGLGFLTVVNEGSGVEFMGSPDIFERFMFDTSTLMRWVDMTNQERIDSAINMQNVVWDGPAVAAASGFLTAGRIGLNPMLFTPNSVLPGSSLSHWDKSATPDLLMEPAITPGLTDDLDLTEEAFVDIGWGPPGACCDRAVGICTDDVLPSNCVAPLEWTEGVLCASLSPPCVARPGIGLTITEIINSNGAGAGASLSAPEGIAVDTFGNVYVVGLFSDNAFKITPAGVITEIINSSSGLNGPFGIAVDGSRNVYVTGSASNNAYKITPGGVITEIINATSGLYSPTGIAVDGSENVYVVGLSSSNAFKITDPGSPSQVITQIIDSWAGGNQFLGPWGVEVDASGNVYVVGAGSHNVHKITDPGSPSQTITEIIDVAGDGVNYLNYPFAIAVDPSGNVYVAGSRSNNIFKITDPGSASQAITQIIDMSGILNDPRGIAVDAAGNVYVTGLGNSKGLIVIPNSVPTEFIDASGAGPGSLFVGPHHLSVAVDNAGENVYVTGAGSHNAFRVQGAQRSRRAFQVMGTADGIGWSWCINELPGPGFTVCDLNVQPVTFGGSAADLVNRFVDTINASGFPGVQAVATGSVFTVTVAGNQRFALGVGPSGQQPNCYLPPSASCTFNPGLEEVVLTGLDCNRNGIDDAIDVANGTSDDLNADGVPDACEGVVPAVSEWGLVIMTLLLLTGLKIKFGRRWSAQV